jgi:hypothetical protein
MTEIPKGWERIEIDGVTCYVGWTEGWNESYWAVTRQGHEIGKGYTQGEAINDAWGTLRDPRCAWLRII